MKKISRLILPLTIFAGLALSSCSAELAQNYSKSDLDMDYPWVDYNIAPTGISFGQEQERLSIEKGQEHTYTYTVEPKGATASLEWSSGNEAVATIDEHGHLTAVGGGHTEITVRETTGAIAPMFLSVDVTVEIESFNVLFFFLFAFLKALLIFASIQVVT